MKSFLVFLAGALTTLVAAGIAAFFLFAPANSRPKDQAVHGAAQLIESADRFTISGTVVVPDALKDVVQNGKGRLSIWLTSDSGQVGLRPIEPNYLHPKFPFKFSHTFSRADLSRNEFFKKDIVLSAYYKPSDDPSPPAERLYVEPRATAFFKLPFSEREILSKSLPSSLELGAVPFYNLYAHSIAEPCLSDSVLLAGKISASQKFMSEMSHNKLALVVYERSLHGWTDDVNPEGRILHEQFLDLSSGSSKFSVPMKKIRFPYYYIFAVRCEAGDALRVCVRRALPLGLEPNGYRRIVLASDLRAPFCGTSDFQGVVGPLSTDFVTRRPGAPGLEEFKMAHP